jgi:hypothetical protein
MTQICIAALILSIARGCPPPPSLRYPQNVIRHPWDVTDSIDIDGLPWWHTDAGNGPYASRLKEFVNRRQGGSMMGPIYVPSTENHTWDEYGWLRPSLGHLSGILKACLEQTCSLRAAVVLP